jgi:prepilin-type N-terminal cleavage/methylation domain-containing protein
MCKLAYKKGFTIVELLVVIAIIAVLVTLSIGGGRMLKLQAEQRLAQGAIEIIVTALELYYDDEGGFPFATNGFVDLDDYISDGMQVIVTITGVSGNNTDASYWSSQALYYFLAKSANSTKIIETISNTLITNTDAGGLPIVAEITIITPSSVTSVDLLRFVDPWGNTLRYTYINGNSFPVITSPGADGDFGTGDDISSQ